MYDDSSTVEDVVGPEQMIKRSTNLYHIVPFGPGTPVEMVIDDPRNERKLNILGRSSVS